MNLSESNATTLSPAGSSSALSKLCLALIFGLLISACGQKGPLIVEPSDPTPTEALQEDAIDIDTTDKEPGGE